nr:helix-turn-helix domain-containing protein [Ruminococcus callidus]
MEDTEAAELRKIREKAGLNRSEFSDATSIPLRTLEDWESGKRKPPFYVIRLLEFFVDHLDA